MNPLLQITIYILLIFQVILGCAVFFQSKARINRYFGVLIFVETIWAFLSVYPMIFLTDSVIVGQFVMLTVAINNTLFVIFTSEASGRMRINKTVLKKIFLPFSIVILPFIFVPNLLFTKHYIYNDVFYGFGPMMIPFSLHVLVSIGLGFHNLYIGIMKATGTNKTNLILIALASTTLWLIAPFTHFLGIGVFNTQLFFIFSPFYTLITLLIITYAIVRNNLFDARLAVLKVFSFLSAALLYAAIAIPIFWQLIIWTQGKQLSALTLSTITVIIFISLTAGYLVLLGFTKKIVLKLLYKDNYGIEVILNDISKILVEDATSVEPLRRALSALDATIYPEEKSSLISSEQDLELNKKAINHDIGYFKKLFQETQSNIIHGGSSLSGMAPERKVYVNLRIDKVNYGYLQITQKRNNKTYSKKDLLLIELVSRQFAMACRNIVQYKKIEGFNIDLKKQIRDATQQLRKKNAELKRKDSEKDEFISTTSHQLRTPITTLNNYNSLLLNKKYGDLDAKQEKVISIMKTVSSKMASTVNDLLSSAQIDNKALQISMDTINLNVLARERVTDIKELAAGKNIRIRLSLTDNNVSICADKIRLGEAISNLLDNALQYSPENSQVLVETTVKDKLAIFRIIDEGDGVIPEQKKLIFSKFGRLDKAQHTRPEGTGLGLFIVKNIVAFHDGQMIFESELGIGSTFGFKIPLKV